MYARLILCLTCSTISRVVITQFPPSSSSGSYIPPFRHRPVLSQNYHPCHAKNLSEFTRSTLSKSVIQNLLAHVTAAEAESATSETERLRVVMDDTDFGPDNVGDNFYTGKIQKEAIVAAKGLIDLCKSISRLFANVNDSFNHDGR